MSDNEIFQVIRRDSLDVFVDKLKTVDRNVTADGGRSMLHVAIAYKKPRHAEQLILHNVDLNFQDNDGQTPLHYAAIHGEVDVAKILVNRKANQLICDKYGNSPLWHAVFNARGNYELVNLYLNEREMITHKNKSGRSPLDFAIQIKDPKLVEILNNQ